MSTNGELPNNLPLFLTDADVASLSDWPGAIEAIRTAYKAPDDEARHTGKDLRPDTSRMVADHALGAAQRPVCSAQSQSPGPSRTACASAI